MSVLFTVAFAVIEHNARALYRAGLLEITIYPLLAFVFVYWLFIAVAIWRSATKYTGPKAWAVLAKFAVVVGVARMLAEFLGGFVE